MISLLLSVTVSMVVRGQAIDPDMLRPYPDNKSGHWAYDAISRMRKEGIIILPNGMYLGNRLYTYLEMASITSVACDALRVTTLGTFAHGLRSQLGDLSARIDALGSHESAQLAEAHATDRAKDEKEEEADIRAYNRDAEDLLRMSSVFGKELDAMGLKTNGIKRDLSDLEYSIRAFRPAVSSSGDSAGD